MKKTMLVLKREQIRLLTTDVLPRIAGGMWPDSRKCLTNVSQKGEAACENTTACMSP